MMGEEKQKKDKRSQMKLFIKKCPKYIVNNKIQLPVLDEYILEHDLVFQQESKFVDKPVGHKVEVFCINNLSDMFEMVTFLNNFPVSPQFSVLSDTIPLGLSTPLTMTAYMKIFVQLQCVKQLDVHDLNTILIQSETGANYKIESDVFERRNDIHFQLITFFIEEVMRYRQGLFTQAEVMAKKKAKKSRDKNKKSLKSMIEEMEKTNDKPEKEEKEEKEESSPENETQGGLSMTVKDDVQGSIFWDFIHELFFNQVNLGLKLRKKFKQDGVDLEEEFQGSEIDQEKFKKRQRFAQQLNAKKLKQKYKSQVKFMKFMKRNEYDNGCILQKTEKLMFKRMLKCFSSSWVEFLRQSLKISLIASYFSKDTLSLIQNDLLKENSGGYFSLSQTQKGVLLTQLIDVIHNLDSFRTIIEYREEVCQELSKELDEATAQMNENKMDAMLLDSKKVGEEDKESPALNGLKDRQVQQRLQCKKLLQLNEYSQLWINGATLLGNDKDNSNYYFFSNQTDKIYVGTKDHNWRYLKDKEITTLEHSLNLNGCKERELHRTIQKFQAYEILQDEETMDLLRRGTEQFYSNTQLSSKKPVTLAFDNKCPLLSQVKQAVLGVENKLSLFLMNSRCRWASLKARKEFKSTLDNLQKFDQLKEFIQFFVESLETIESLKINTQKLNDSFSNLRESDYKYLNAVSSKKEVNNDTIFQDLKLFELMEQLGVIEHQAKVKLKLWTYSGEKIKKYWFTYLELVDSPHSLNFLVNVLLFTVEQHSYFELEGEVYQDQELADYAFQCQIFYLSIVDKEDRKSLKEKYKMIPKDQLIEIE